MPGVFLRALSEYKFVGTPLWRMFDGKDLVRVELTFHKALPTKSYYKKRDESRRQPAPFAGEWPRQPAPASRPPPRREPTPIERETLPPPTEIVYTTDTTTDHQTKLQEHSYHHRIDDHYQTSTSTSVSHLRRKPEKSLQHQRQIARSSIALTTTKKNTRSTRNTPSRMLSATNHGKDVAIIKAQINPEEDEMNIDLPAYFLHRPWRRIGCSSRDQRPSTIMKILYQDGSTRSSE